METTCRNDNRVQDAVIGILLVLFGTVMLLQHLDLFYLEDLGIRSVWHLWPLIFVVVGISKFFGITHLQQIGGGVWWIFLGAWLYVSIYHVYDLSFRETWPAMLVAVGVSMLWESYWKHHRRSLKENGHE